MKKLLTSIFCLLLFYSFLLSQSNYDKTWVLGYGDLYWPNFIGGTNIVFQGNSADTSSFNMIAYMDSGKSCISNKNGQLQFYSGGCLIYNHQNQLMENGDSLNYPGEAYNLTCSPFPYSFYYTLRSLLSLPLPNSDSLYYLFHMRYDGKWLGPNKLRTPTSFLYTKIDMSKNNGLGRVEEKNVSLKYDTMAESLTAVRHGNGRDWWIPVSDWGTNKMFMYQLTPNGIEGPIIKNAPLPLVGDPKNGWLCQDVFSPDGSRYARFCGPLENSLHVFRFDRCSGTFYDSLQLFFPNDTIPAAGVAFSQNGRFLYTSTGYLLWQFDLDAVDVSASRIQIAHYENIPAPYLPANFYQMQLAPNGKIYMSGTNGVTYLHVINEPDKKGLDCNFVQRGLKLPTHNGEGLPNFPNFRLKEWKGSPCDSLTVKVGEPKWEREQLLIYPNPTNESVSFSTARGNGYIYVYNVLGICNRILKIDSRKLEWETKDVPNGIYMVRHIDINGKLLGTYRLSIQH